MRVIDRLRDIFAARRSNAQNPNLAQRIVYVESTIAGVRASPDTVLQASVVWACVNVLCKSVGQLPWRLHRRTGANSSEIADNLYLDYLLNERPNSEMGAFSFRETLMGHALLWGNAYAEIERDGAGRAIALWPIEPDRVTPRRRLDDRRTLYYEVRNEYGPVAELDASDVFHLHGLSWNGIEGYRVVAYAAQTLGLSMALERFGATFFGNGAQLGGVIKNPKSNLDPDGREVLLGRFNEKHRGPDKAHRWAYLDGGMDAVPFSAKPNEAQFVEARTFQVEEICRVFGVPPHKVAHLLRATNNNIEHQGIEFVTDGILPWTVKLEQEANFKLIGARNAAQLFTRIDVRSLQRGDLAARTAWNREMWSTGAFSANDILHGEGMNPISEAEGGNKRFVPVNYQPLDTATAPQPKGAPANDNSDQGGEGGSNAGEPDDTGGSQVAAQVIQLPLRLLGAHESQAKPMRKVVRHLRDPDTNQIVESIVTEVSEA